LSDLANPSTVVILCAPAVPCGNYANQALTRAGVKVTPKSQEQDVNAVITKVSTGEADAGIVYVTDVKSAATSVTGIEIPEQHQVLARYPIAVVKDSKNARLAHGFVDYLLSPAGQSVLAEFGFSKP